ncbi:MAG: amidoligase family protein [Escherichia coli]|nr:amidoligase family protein [Escherichia coli]
MIGIKDQCFGVEIELTGITRAEAAEALGAYFETTPQRSYDNYDSWYVPDREGKQWRIMSDGSIRAEWNDDGHYARPTNAPPAVKRTGFSHFLIFSFISHSSC